MKRVFIAKVEIEIVVVAESEDAAREVAYRNWQEEQVFPEDFEIGRLSHVPGGYEDDSVVYTDGREVMDFKDAEKLPGSYCYEAPKDPEADQADHHDHGGRKARQDGTPPIDAPAGGA